MNNLLDRYYRLVPDHSIENFWYLRAPIDTLGNEIDARIFTEGRPVQVAAPLTVPLRRKGRSLDLTFGDFEMLVVRRSLGAKLEGIEGLNVQRIAITVDGSDEFEILNLLDRVDAVDAENSVFVRWVDSDRRPEKTGSYRMITELRIDPQRTKKCDLFRLGEWPVAVIASDRVKHLLEAESATGVSYQRVA